MIGFSDIDGSPSSPSLLGAGVMFALRDSGQAKTRPDGTILKTVPYTQPLVLDTLGFGIHQ